MIWDGMRRLVGERLRSGILHPGALVKREWISTVTNEVDIRYWTLSRSDGLEGAGWLGEADGVDGAEVHAHDEEQVLFGVVEQCFTEEDVCDDGRARQGVGRGMVRVFLGVIGGGVENVNLSILRRHCQQLQTGLVFQGLDGLAF